LKRRRTATLDTSSNERKGIEMKGMSSQRFNQINRKMWEIAYIGDGPGGSFTTGLRFNKTDTLATDAELAYFGKSYGLYLHYCEHCGKSYFKGTGES
jgi:hypothetical protein